MDKNARSGTATARVVGDCEIDLWGLPAFERLRRQLAMQGIQDVASADIPPTTSGSVLLLRADWLFELRTITDLLARDVVLVDDAGIPVAAHVPAERYTAARDLLLHGTADGLDDLERSSVGELSPAYNDRLRKAEPPRLFPVRADNRAALERFLFDGAYKGITDVITKFAWPAPARAVVRGCTRFGITPNMVTVSSVILVVAATWLFWHGYFWSGLVLGWLMTFFDTVDGKLARVTVHATSIGHALDKGTDLIHPPIWYIAWGFGLHLYGGPDGMALWNVYVVILAGYILGRLAEGGFDLLCGFALYTWQPVDAWVRLIIARRNPNLILLTLALALGEPEIGLYAVAGWTAVSTVYLAVRLAQAAALRVFGSGVESWLKSVTDADQSLSARIFARRDLPAGLRGA